MTRYTTCEVRPYFADGERYPGLIGVKADGDEYERAFVSKAEMIDRMDERDRLIADMLRWMPCPKTCRDCKRWDMHEGCEYQRRAREMGVRI